MHYFLFYNELGDVVGWLETEHWCSSKNAKEVTKEEFLVNGGAIGVYPETKFCNSKNETENVIETLLVAIIQ